jgi:hypothetical protein
LRGSCTRTYAALRFIAAIAGGLCSHLVVGADVARRLLDHAKAIAG